MTNEAQRLRPVAVAWRHSHTPSPAALFPRRRAVCDILLCCHSALTRGCFFPALWQRRGAITSRIHRRLANLHRALSKPAFTRSHVRKKTVIRVPSAASYACRRSEAIFTLCTSLSDKWTLLRNIESTSICVAIMFFTRNYCSAGSASIILFDLESYICICLSADADRRFFLVIVCKNTSINKKKNLAPCWGQKLGQDFKT